MSKEQIKDRFIGDVKGHLMTVELDNAVHRSLLFKDPGRGSIYHFRINTWPNHLSISGDMGCYVFARLHDMFEFFRSDDLSINIGYWTEKLQAISCFGSRHRDIREFCGESTATTLENYWLENIEEITDEQKEVIAAVREADEDHEAARIMADAAIDDYYDFLQYTPTLHIQWCLYAIVWAIQQYDRLPQKVPQPPVNDTGGIVVRAA